MSRVGQGRLGGPHVVGKCRARRHRLERVHDIGYLGVQGPLEDAPSDLLVGCGPVTWHDVLVAGRVPDPACTAPAPTWRAEPPGRCRWHVDRSPSAECEQCERGRQLIASGTPAFRQVRRYQSHQVGPEHGLRHLVQELPVPRSDGRQFHVLAVLFLGPDRLCLSRG